MEEAEKRYKALSESMDALQQETLVLWCLSSLTRLSKTCKSPANVVSFFQFRREVLDQESP